MYKYLFLLFFVFSNPFSVLADDWGKTGHRVVGEIAEEYLDEKAKRAISDLLDGHSLAFVSNHADEIKSDRKYDSFGPWHYVNFPFGEKYENHPKSQDGDIVQGIQTCIDVLKDDKSSRDDKSFYLKMLIHFIGDLHQPLHIGIADDKGGNDFQVRWFNSGTNLHTVWDSKMLSSYEMSYTEVAANADELTRDEVIEMQKGTVLDWVYDSRQLCEDVYANTKIGEKLGYRYMYDYMDTVRLQLQKGGVRLASVLNEIFGDRGE